MTQLTDRQINIILKLEEGDYVTSETLSLLYKVSTRTIKEDIKLIKELSIKLGINIVGHPGKGYVSNVVNQELYNSFLTETKNTRFTELFKVPSERKTRQDYILIKLLTVDYYIKTDDLSAELYIDRSTLLNDIKDIREVLKKYNLNIENNPLNGIKIIGSEIGFRMCISERVFHRDTYELNNEVHFDIKESIDKTEYSTISSILYQVLERYNIKISHDSFENFVFHIIIAKNRWFFYNYVSTDYEHFSNVKDTEFLDAGISLVKRIEEEFSIILPFEESVYFGLHFKTKRIFEKTDVSKVSDYTEKLVNGFLETIKKKFDIDFLNDFDLITSLSYHFPVMISRLKLGFTIRNRKIFDYSRRYLYAHIIVSHSSEFIEKEIGCKLSYCERAYIILYINLAIIRLEQSRKTKILLITSGSRSENMLLYHELSQVTRLPINSIDMVSFGEKLDALDNDEYDCIVSNTTDIKVLNKPVIYLENSELRNKHFKKILSSVRGIKWQFENLISKENYFSNINVESMDELMDNLKKYDIGEVEELGNNVALSSCITESEFTSFRIIVFKKPLLMNTKYVQLIIHAQLSKSFYWENFEILKEVSRFISDKNLVLDFLKNQSRDELIAKLS